MMQEAVLSPLESSPASEARKTPQSRGEHEPTHLEEQCQAVMSHHAKSFRWAALFLSKRQRADSAIAYAYCRFVDDSVDEAPNPKAARAALQRLTQELEGEVSPSPLFKLYGSLAERASFGLEPARDLLKGAASDLGKVQLEDDEELLTYCYRVAGTVGLMMSGILGVEAESARQHAIDLGIGMQLTNICRDVLEDAERGRVYLPAKRLHEYGSSPQDLIQYATDRNELSQDELESLTRSVVIVVDELLDMAENKYRSGEAGFKYLPVRARLAITVAAYLYRHIGRTLISEQDANPLKGRVSVNWRNKVLLTTRALGAWSLSGLGLSRSHPIA
jgi:phytoene synthase